MSRHHHRHSIWYRMRRWFRHNKKAAACSAAVIAAAVLGTGGVFYYSYQQQAKYHVTAGNSKDMKGGYRTRTYDGKEYQYNNTITTILYVELDSEGKMTAEAQYGGKARAETLTLAILDEKKNKINVLTLDGATLSEFHDYDSRGKDLGTCSGAIGEAYSRGDGGEVSCTNLQGAAEALLGGITINEYVVANRASKEEIHALADGLMAYMGEFAELIESNDLDLAEQQEQLMKENLQTSITRNKYQSLARAIDQTSEGILDYYQLKGEQQTIDGEEVFVPDEQELERLIIDLFYEEI